MRTRSVAFALSLLGTGGLLALAFEPGVADMVRRWLAAGGYYGHGPFVLPVSLWLAWRERARLREVAWRPSAAGLLVVAAALIVAMLGRLGEIRFAENVALLGVVAGTILAWFGPAVARRLAFPLGFLLFMIPLPPVLLLELTFRLKELSTALATASLQFLGADVLREGSTLRVGAVALTIDESCSGLRTAILTLAVASLLAWLERGSRAKAGLILALALPACVGANVARILLACALLHLGVSLPPGSFLHEAVGLLTYAIALGALLALWLLPLRRARRSPPREGAPVPAARDRRLRLSTVAPTIALLAAAAVGSSALEKAPPAAPTDRTAAIPLQVGRWRGKDFEILPGAESVLGTADVIHRRYANVEEGTHVDLFASHSPDARRIAHPPEFCFSGAGLVTLRSERGEIEGPTGPIPTTRVVLEGTDGDRLVHYWYRLGEEDVGAHHPYLVRALLSRFAERPKAGSLIRLATPLRSGETVAAERTFEAFAREALPAALAALDGNLP